MSLFLKQKHDKNRKLTTGAKRLSISKDTLRLCVPTMWNDSRIIRYADTVVDLRVGTTPLVWKIFERYEFEIAIALREVQCPESKTHKHVMLTAVSPTLEGLLDFAFEHRARAFTKIALARKK